MVRVVCTCCGITKFAGCAANNCLCFGSIHPYIRVSSLRFSPLFLSVSLVCIRQTKVTSKGAASMLSWQSLQLFTAGFVPAHRNTPGLWYTAVPLLILAAITALFADRAQRLIHIMTGKRLFKPHNSEQPNSDSRPSGGHIDASDIAISQHPDGIPVLLGSGSAGKVCLQNTQAAQCLTAVIALA